MDATVEQRDEMLRQGFRKFNPFMVLMFRLGLRRWINIWPTVFGRIMVIRHTGRKSGISRYTPLNYAIIDGDIYCTAGFGAKADWYRNILANPQVEVWLPDRRVWGTVEDVSESENRLSLMREVIIASGFAGVVAGVDPRKMSDEEFDKVTKPYRLVRIRPQAEITGEGGPGDLAWVWLPVLVILLSVRKKRKRK